MANLLSGTRIYGTANVDTQINVNTNLTVNGVSIVYTGNTTTLPTITLANTGSLTIGNSTTTQTASVISVANSTGNVQITPSAFNIRGTILNAAFAGAGSLGITGTANGFLATGNNNGGALYLGANFANSFSPTAGIEAGWQGTTTPTISIGTLRGDSRNYILQDYVGRTYFNYQTSQLATTLVAGVQYTILGNSAAANSTDFTLFGAASSIPGVVFTASISGNAASGNGTAIPSSVSGNTRLYISAAGNIGIGNTSPVDRLSVSGTAVITGNTTVVNVYSTGAINAASHTVSTSFVANSTVLTTTGSLSAANLTTTTNVATFGTAVYHVANGNVGISNNAPNDTLSVNGTLFVNTSVTVGNSTINTIVNSAAVSVGGIFYENSKTLTTSYTITTGKSAMSVGPITLNSGVTVTVPSGSKWVVL